MTKDMVFPSLKVLPGGSNMNAKIILDNSFNELYKKWKAGEASAVPKGKIFRPIFRFFDTGERGE
jgi:hypothetical protein